MEAPTQDDNRLQRSLLPPSQQQRGQRRP